VLDKKLVSSQLSLLPTEKQPWPRLERIDLPEDDKDDYPRDSITAYTKARNWDSPDQIIYFFCDIHADADAFLLSLLASGGIALMGPADDDFVLTEQGSQALFIIGGDCFDKGPSTLDLLDLIYQLKLKGAEVILLAGNHDIRTYMGILYAEHKDPLLDHMFVRMAVKSAPLFKEI